MVAPRRPPSPLLAAQPRNSPLIVLGQPQECSSDLGRFRRLGVLDADTSQLDEIVFHVLGSTAVVHRAAIAGYDSVHGQTVMQITVVAFP